MLKDYSRSLALMSSVLLPAISFAASAQTSMRLLYPSFAGSWATAWIAKEAGYFQREGLDVELDSRRRQHAAWSRRCSAAARRSFRPAPSPR